MLFSRLGSSPVLHSTSPGSPVPLHSTSSALHVLARGGLLAKTGCRSWEGGGVYKRCRQIWLARSAPVISTPSRTLWKQAPRARERGVKTHLDRRKSSPPLSRLLMLCYNLLPSSPSDPHSAKRWSSLGSSWPSSSPCSGFEPAGGGREGSRGRLAGCQPGRTQSRRTRTRCRRRTPRPRCTRRGNRGLGAGTQLEGSDQGEKL